MEPPYQARIGAILRSVSRGITPTGQSLRPGEPGYMDDLTVEDLNHQDLIYVAIQEY